jgi:hypothetical protein
MADDKRQTLDIPLGTTFEFKDGKLVFGHESDIVIRTNMGGYKFQKIFSKRGNVQVLPPEGVEFDVEEIEAPNGDVFLNGRVRAKLTRARTVHFQEGQLTADLIEAKEEVVLAGAKVTALHVKAPKVTIDPDADGMVLVVESQSEMGRTRARGAFRSVAEARAAVEQFRRLFGDGPATGSPAASAPAPTASATSAPAATAAPAATSAPAAPSASASSEDLNQTYPGLPSASGDSPALPKSSVFRKRT